MCGGETPKTFTRFTTFTTRLRDDRSCRRPSIHGSRPGIAGTRAGLTAHRPRCTGAMVVAAPTARSRSPRSRVPPDPALALPFNLSLTAQPPQPFLVLKRPPPHTQTPQHRPSAPPPPPHRPPPPGGLVPTTALQTLPAPAPALGHDPGATPAQPVPLPLMLPAFHPLAILRPLLMLPALHPCALPRPLRVVGFRCHRVFPFRYRDDLYL